MDAAATSATVPTADSVTGAAGAATAAAVADRPAWMQGAAATSVVVAVVLLYAVTASLNYAAFDSIVPAAGGTTLPPVCGEHTTASECNARERVAGQYAETTGRVALHRRLLLVFLANQHASFIAFTAAAGVAAIMLVFVTRGDAAAAPVHLRTLLVVATVSAAVVAGVQSGLQFQQHHDANRQAYLRYQSLRQEIDTFLRTDELSQGAKAMLTTQPAGTAGAATSGPSSRAASSAVSPPLSAEEQRLANVRHFALYVDARMAELNSLPVGVDFSKAPTLDSISNGALPGN